MKARFEMFFLTVLWIEQHWSRILQEQRSSYKLILKMDGTPKYTLRVDNEVLTNHSKT